MTQDSSNVVRFFTAHHIPQEYWTIRSSRCDCGGHWEGGDRQSVADIDGIPSDVHEARCADCKQVTTFVFDVSPFFSRHGELRSWAERTLPDAEERIRNKVIRKVGPAFMARFVTFVQQRENDGDVPTLLYLRSRIDAALDALSPKDEGSAS